jgi:hypothetical protein
MSEKGVSPKLIQIAIFTKTFDDKSMLAVLDSTKQARLGSLELGLAQICDLAEPTNQLVLLTCGPSNFWEYTISIATTMQGGASQNQVTTTTQLLRCSLEAPFSKKATVVHNL